MVNGNHSSTFIISFFAQTISCANKTSDRHWAVCLCVTLLVILLLLAPFFPVRLSPPPLSPVCEFCLILGTGISGDVRLKEAVRWNSREFSPSRLTQQGSLHQPKPVRLLFSSAFLSWLSVWLLMMAVFLYFLSESRDYSCHTSCFPPLINLCFWPHAIDTQLLLWEKNEM